MNNKKVFVKFLNGKQLTIECKAWTIVRDKEYLLFNRNGMSFDTLIFSQGNAVVIPMENVLYAIEVKDENELRLFE
jgi:hypothetical protein